MSRRSLSGMIITRGSVQYNPGNNDPYKHGGGIENLGTLTINDCTVSGNFANDGGGGITNAGTLTITASTINGNYTQWGGGIENLGTLTINDCTISGNST